MGGGYEWCVDVLTCSCYSYNTHPYLGCGISRNRAILRCGYRMYNIEL